MKSLTGFIILLIITAGCSTFEMPDIQIAEFAGYTEIEKGESATLKWNIENADVVKITNLGTILKGNDSVTVQPMESLSYSFIAYNDYDTISLSWQVKVLDEMSKDLGKGFTRLNSATNEISFTESNYLRGVNNAGDINNLKSIKVMKRSYSQDSTLQLNAILLDDFGNYLPAIDEDTKWVIKSECADNNIAVEINNFTEKHFNADSPLEIALLIENSVIAGEQFPIMEYIESYLYSLNKNDKISIDYFNQSIQAGISLTTADKLKGNPAIYDKPIPDGLNAYYKAAYKTIQNFKNEIGNENKIVIIISFSADNASIIFKANDVSSIANQYGIPVYTIGIGSAVESYPLKYISDVSGGRFYDLPEEELFNLPHILNEISFSQKAYYQIDYSLQNNDCNYTMMELGIISSGEATDNIKIHNKPEGQYSGYQAVAAFNERDTIVSEDFFESVRSLARVLKDNPNSIIELIGNSSIEGNFVVNRDLSLKRAQSVRRLLIETGANPEQIRVRGEGAAEPLYYFQEREWQKYFNRRVEIRWLNPELLPFEIIANVRKSEEEALKDVESWENAGYKSYYQRYISNDLPVYRVKLWGYATEEEAQNEAMALEKKYHVSFVVQ